MAEHADYAVYRRRVPMILPRGGAVPVADFSGDEDLVAPVPRSAGPVTVQ